MEKRGESSCQKEGINTIQKEPAYVLRSKVQLKIMIGIGRGQQKIHEQDPPLMITTPNLQVSIPSLDTLLEIQESCDSFVSLNSKERRSKESFELQLLYFPDEGESN